ncbi:MAG: SlyX family protein [Rhodoferax sp.]
MTERLLPNAMPVDAARAVDERLTQLEIKASYADDWMEQIDRVLMDQQAQIERLQRELQWLRQHASEPAPGAQNLRDELPPHY